MTEEDAKTKWCPYSRLEAWPFPPDSPMATGYTAAEVNQGRCIGSACMAWRWVQRVKNQDDLDAQSNMMMYPVKRIRPILENTEQGHCGLAGKP